MMKKTEAERLALAEKRILSVVTRHGAIIARTLEQKISDAGPFGQRIDPHVLTMARQALGRGKRIGSIEKGGYPWYFLTTDNRQLVNQRVDEQLAVLQRLHSHDLSLRTGQSLEIAFYRAIHATQNETGLSLLGSFTDLEKHDDKTLYSKEEPPSSIHGKTISGKKKLDFLILGPPVGKINIVSGVEVKNVREWLYPDRDEIKHMLMKCCEIDAIPVLIARRIPYVTSKLLIGIGGVVHQTFQQLIPESDKEIAELARNKKLLGFHDIRTGNDPDSRMTHFVKTLPSLLPARLPVFQQFQDLASDYGSGNIGYKEFMARVRRRRDGTNEDHDWDDPKEWEYKDF